MMNSFFFIGTPHVLVTLIKLTQSARILGVFPTPAFSHQVVFQPLMIELANRGHEVVVITTIPIFTEDNRPQNYKEIDVNNKSSSYWKSEIDGKVKGNKNFKTKGKELICHIFNDQFKSEQVQKIINDRNISFDLVIVESYYRMAVALSHRYKCPIIQISSFGASYTNYEMIGAPSHPLLYPNVLRKKILNMSIWDTLKELYDDQLLTLGTYYDEEFYDEVAQNIFPGTSKLSDLDNNIQMLFLNIHPIWEGLRPVPSNVIYISKIHLNSKGEITKELKSYLDTSFNGVIYVSFGSNVNTAILPKEIIQMFINVFSKLPCNILWKWDSDELPGKTENIKISKWWPQYKVLKHPNVKLFITQGGLQSTEEAIEAGVPLIGIPLVNDQWLNSEKYVLHKIGVKLDIANIDENNFESAIKMTLNDKSYHHNIRRLRELINDKPYSSLDHAIWWTEHLLQNKDILNLRGPAANIAWAQYYEVNLIISILICFIIILLLVYWAIVKIFSFIYLKVN